VKAIPIVLAAGDLVGCAQTGTGKTAAFVVPLLQRLEGPSGVARALVLAPTRELAIQIGERARAYGHNAGIKQAVIYGGVNQKRQETELRERPELLVATPGRLLDLMRQGFISLKHIQILVLDEADTMLDMGFIHDIRRIVSDVPSERQTLLFSATMPDAIRDLVRSVTKNPSRVAVDPQSTPAERVQQSVYFVERRAKRVLLQQVLAAGDCERTLVFTRTKHGANRLVTQLDRSGTGARAIHGNKSQSAREQALGDFRAGRIQVLVATDVAARGIDIQGVSLVVNYDLPQVPESYVHRIGRTGRAGRHGRAVSFCDSEERPLLRGIERLIRVRIDVVEHEFDAPAERPLMKHGNDTGSAQRGAPVASASAPSKGNSSTGPAANRRRRRIRRPRGTGPRATYA
jgi:ATP-dependent RNA helicase RhlE